jgi:hypothetical protein
MQQRDEQILCRLDPGQARMARILRHRHHPMWRDVADAAGAVIIA